jgi:ABC-type glycerol-3-phosphate transport system permease component
MTGARMELGFAALRYAALTLIAAILLLPIYWLIMSSFRPADEIFRFAGAFGIDTLIPRTLTLENYQQIFSGSFPRALFNSLFVASRRSASASSSTPWPGLPLRCSISRSRSRCSSSCCCPS